MGGKCASCNADITDYTDGSALCVYCDGVSQDPEAVDVP